jgi:formylglycine-generating enzyme required for sulfatase activity
VSKLRPLRPLRLAALVSIVAACRLGVPTGPASPPPSEAAGTNAKLVAVSGDAGPPPRDPSPPVEAAAADAGPPAPAAVPTAPDDMAFVKGGTFKMGTDEGGEQDERPAHDVTVASFFLDKTEVTQAAYDECVAAKVCTAADPSILATFGTLEAPGPFKGPKRPVIGITWQSAVQYCEWRGKRLPREAEFERAVRGEDGRKFPWGNEPPTKERTVFSPSNFPEDVGTHPMGRGPYGHDDLAGNVWEWMADDYDPIAYTRATASEGKPGNCDEIIAAQNKLRAEGREGFTGTNPIPTECEKSIRGGAYNYGAAGLRSTNRVHHHARFKLRMLGFRCAKDAG